MSKQEKLGDDVPLAIEFPIEELRDASGRFEEGKDGGRAGEIAALSAVIEFMRPYQNMTHDNWLQPLIALQSALFSLNDGNVVPMLAPKRQRGRSPDSILRESARAMAVATVRRLCEIGLRKTDACDRVAKVCREVSLKPGRKGKDTQGQEHEIKDRTVRGWCDKVDEDVGRQSDGKLSRLTTRAGGSSISRQCDSGARKA
jgi:hypothetical protein